jgi:hypothetical protein
MRQIADNDMDAPGFSFLHLFLIGRPHAYQCHAVASLKVKTALSAFHFQRRMLLG